MTDAGQEAFYDAPPAISSAAPSNEGDGVFVFPASFAQTRMWLLEQMEPEAALYHIPGAYRLTGSLDRKALADALNEIVRRHEILRTTFDLEDDEPVQIVHAHRRIDLPCLDISATPVGDREARVIELARRDRLLHFDMVTGPLFRATLLYCGRDEHVLLLTMHHIISDGWSAGVLWRELAALYNAFSAGKPSPLPDLPLQYADFTIWQREKLRGDALSAETDFWRQRLGSGGKPLELATRSPAMPAAYEAGLASRRLATSLSQDIAAFSQQEGVTVFMTLVAALNTLFYRYTGQSDISIGTPIANRNRHEIEGLIGFFVNTLVLRTDLSGNPSFRDLLARVAETCTEAYEHQDLPFEKLVEELNPVRDVNHTPLFQVLVTYQNIPKAEARLDGLEVTRIHFTGNRTPFSLSVTFTTAGKDLHAAVHYQTASFDRSFASGFLAHLETLLGAVVNDPGAPIDALPLLTPAEQEILKRQGQGPKRPLPETCVHEFIEAQAGVRPHDTAVICGSDRLTYSALSERVHRLAWRLVAGGLTMSSDGVQPVVAVLAERSAELLCAMLAIQKVGGIYMPLDPRAPVIRLRGLIEQADAKAVLATATQHGLAVDAAGALSVLPLEDDPHARAPVSNPKCAVTHDHVAYLIFTSGSTGVPKGVLVPHRGLVNHILAEIEALSLKQEDRLAQTAPQIFDASIWQFLSPLVAGGALHIYGDEVAFDPARLLPALADDCITVWDAVPSYLRAALDTLALAPHSRRLPCLRWLYSGGEALTPALARELEEAFPGVTLANGYGPTECSDGVTCHIVPAPVPIDATSVPIGRPLSNIQLYVLDRNMQMMPQGFAGELFIGGLCVANGYYGDPARTAECFVPDPFSNAPGARLYRTGDQVRWREDGLLEYQGRADRQVKVRGMRVELGEIEGVMMRLPGVSEAAVLFDETAGGRILGFVTARPGQSLRETRLMEDLRARLPVYMVPSVVVVLDDFPRTPTGKLDRTALPAHHIPDPAEPSSALPSTPTELVVAAIWSDLLGVEHVGIHDNFFQLGGHSLLAVRLVTRLRTSLAANLPLTQIFVTPTIAGLCEYLSDTEQAPGQTERLARFYLKIRAMSDYELQQAAGSASPRSNGINA